VFAGANRLGALLLQFPWSFKFTEEDRQCVAELRRRFRQYPLGIEVGHNSWNDPHALNMLVGLGIGFCNIDQPLIGRSLRLSTETTSLVGYLRLHDRNYRNWFADVSASPTYRRPGARTEAHSGPGITSALRLRTARSSRPSGSDLMLVENSPEDP
jgi:uncharacterized protein YecE (DUF72 family)